MWHVVLVNAKVLIKEHTKHNATDQTLVSWALQPVTHSLEGDMTCMDIWVPIDACADTAECLLSQTQLVNKHN